MLFFDFRCASALAQTVFELMQLIDECASALTSEEWGERAFQVRDPNGVIVQLVDWNAAWHPAPIELRSLGDSPAISLILNPRGGSFRTIPSPRFGPTGEYVPGAGHPVRVCESIDVRFLLEDMFAKIRKFGHDSTHPLGRSPGATSPRT